MPLIREAIVTTVNAQGEPHIAPLGLIVEGEGWILAPFHPSTTLDNLRQAPFAVANFTDDVRVFAGCLTRRRHWPLTPATVVAAPRLAATLSHIELVVVFKFIVTDVSVFVFFILVVIDVLVLVFLRLGLGEGKGPGHRRRQPSVVARRECE